ncbi:hypothetical protein Bca52824_006311 [Brassica carinata]|uniref:Uncharacterized protein n=1 Tax=Brassica carinata TaxID=52824 RepID=A0A8X7WRV5_BRACI|nr:hypothetical protein Bca52824_006311 [Brassica carinata]
MMPPNAVIIVTDGEFTAIKLADGSYIFTEIGRFPCPFYIPPRDKEQTTNLELESAMLIVENPGLEAKEASKWLSEIQEEGVKTLAERVALLLKKAQYLCLCVVVLCLSISLSKLLYGES